MAADGCAVIEGPGTALRDLDMPWKPQHQGPIALCYCSTRSSLFSLSLSLSLSVSLLSLSFSLSLFLSLSSLSPSPSLSLSLSLSLYLSFSSRLHPSLHLPLSLSPPPFFCHTPPPGRIRVPLPPTDVRVCELSDTYVVLYLSETEPRVREPRH